MSCRLSSIWHSTKTFTTKTHWFQSQPPNIGRDSLAHNLMSLLRYDNLIPILRTTLPLITRLIIAVLLILPFGSFRGPTLGRIIIRFSAGRGSSDTISVCRYGRRACDCGRSWVWYRIVLSLFQL